MTVIPTRCSTTAIRGAATARPRSSRISGVICRRMPMRSYESVVLKSAGRIIPVGCWAHARREFFDARLNQPREVHYVLGLIGQMYDIEDEIRLLSSAERLAARQDAKRADSRSVGGIPARAAWGCVAQEPVWQSDRLLSEPLGRAPPVHRQTAFWRSTTTSQSVRCGCAPSDARTGCF